MKVLWLINIPIPKAAQALGLQVYQGGGWIISQFEELEKTKDVKLTVLSAATDISEIKTATVDGIDHIVFPRGGDMGQTFKDILNQYNPDIVHIYGTEFSHSLDMLTVCDKSKTVVNIQGIITECARVALYGLPNKLTRISPIKKAIYKIKKIPSARELKTDFETRAKVEQLAFSKTQNVIGRSSWDKFCVTKINPDINYYFCNENLRKEFYTEQKWSVDSCQRYSIFISQADYAIKGLHLFLPHFATLLKKYPSAKLFIGGDPIIDHKNKIKNAIGDYIYDYGGYIKQLIKQYNLQDNIEFLGVLSAEQMKNQYLQSNVFLSCSLIENESNSISEAKILGVPVVSSFVGGVTDRFCQGEDGFIYPLTEPFMAAFYIDKLFFDNGLCQKISQKAIQYQKNINDKQKNTTRLMTIYQDILQKNELQRNL